MIGKFAKVILFWLVSFGIAENNPMGISDIVSPSVVGCSGTPNATRGFNVKYYTYPLESTYGYEDDFYLTKYKEVGSYFGSVEGVTDLQFSSGVPASGKMLVYGKPVEPTNFTLEITGYYRAPEWGNYTFILSHNDDMLSLQIGANTCCPKSADILSVIRQDHIRNYHDRKPYAYTVLLEAGQYYPMRLVYFNRHGPVRLSLTLTLPDGTTRKDFSNVFHFDESKLPVCAITETHTTIPAQVSATTTLVETGMFTTNGDLGIRTNYIVETPIGELPTITRTRYNQWTGDFIRTQYHTSFYTKFSY